MTNKLKSPTTLILIFLLNVASLSACSAADDLVRLGRQAGSQADDLGRLGRQAGNQADDIARLGIPVQEWTQQVATQYAQEEISAAMSAYGGLPENFLPKAQERITQKIIDDANSKGVKLSVVGVSTSVSTVLTAIVMNQPARATPNEEGRDNNADGERMRGRRRTNY